MRKKKTVSRTRRTKANSVDSPTAGKVRESSAAMYFEKWGTMAAPSAYSNGKPTVRLWGNEEDARLGADPDEQIVRVFVIVLEVQP